MSAISLTIRRNALETARTWTIDSTGLTWTGGAADGHFDFADIAAIRLEYAGTRFNFVRYVCSVVRRNGWTEEIISTDYNGIARFTDRAADYSPFVRALISATAAANPGCRFLAGASPAKYALNIAVVVAAALLLAGVIVSIGVPLTAVIVAKGAVILFLLPLVVAWFRRNRPRSFNPQHLPDGLLP